MSGHDRTVARRGGGAPSPPGAVATFLVRILEGVDGFVVPDSLDDAFDDDDGYAPHERNINIAANLGILNGYGDGTFRPRDLVSRAQMAKLVVLTLVAAGVDVPEVNDDAFDDDDESVHEPFIDALAALDVVDGVQVGTYDPSGTVRRDTMALYLARSVQVLVDAALWEPYAAPVAAAVVLAAS